MHPFLYYGHGSGTNSDVLGITPALKYTIVDGPHSLRCYRSSRQLLRSSGFCQLPVLVSRRLPLLCVLRQILFF
jgi:hypothetical protein